MSTKRTNRLTEQPESESTETSLPEDVSTPNTSTEPTEQPKSEPSLAEEILTPETAFTAEKPTLPIDSTGLQKLGLPYCEKCGYQLVSGLYGEPICAVPGQVDAEQCPRLK